MPYQIKGLKESYLEGHPHPSVRPAKYAQLIRFVPYRDFPHLIIGDACLFLSARV